MLEHHPRVRAFIKPMLGIFLTLVIGILLTIIDPRDESFSGFVAYFIITTIAIIFIGVSWKSIRSLDPPRWLFTALVLGFSLRLLFGVGLTVALPTLGYPDSTPHQAGYLFFDAYSRDTDAWNLARSDESLLTVWKDSDLSDQYGGLLYTSALIYRTFSPEVRRPMLVLLLTSSIGSIAVLFTWIFAQKRLGTKAAAFAAWVVALYPEAIFLGASHMREPFLITALSLGIAGYVLWRDSEHRKGIYLMLAGAVLALIVSPPFLLILSIVILGAWMWEGRGKSERRIFTISMLVLIGLVAALLTLRAWSKIEGRPDGNPIELVMWWLTSGAEYQLKVLQEESGWVVTVFGMVPDWFKMPLATIYGLVQPFLPAALMDATSAPLIRAIVSLRALGWFFLLPFLICAPFAAFRQNGWRSLPMYLAILVWVTAIFVSYRDAGRAWDNPRWRTIFLCVQAAISGWTWITFRKTRNPWLLRVGMVIGFATLAFIHWEAGRYYHTPRLSLWKTLLLIVGFSVIYLIGTILYDYKKGRSKRLET